MSFFHKEKPLAISIDRDSVCMADDCDSYCEKITITEKTDITELFIILSKFVPDVGKATWKIETNKGLCGYISKNVKNRANFELCIENETLVEAGISEVMCKYRYENN